MSYYATIDATQSPCAACGSTVVREYKRSLSYRCDECGAYWGEQ